MPANSSPDHEIHRRHVLIYEAVGIQIKLLRSIFLYRYRAALLSLLVLPYASLPAFDYLEHSLFTDRACHEAQKMLSTRLSTASADQKSRYLALALLCPARWKTVYCENNRKAVQAPFSVAAAEKREHAVTLGDYSALVDHFTEYGRVLHFSGAADPGLTDLTWKWMHPQKAEGGIARDIGGPACRLEEAPDWYRVEADVSSFFAFWHQYKRAPRLHSALLDEHRRGEVAAGPSDPSALYTIRNPRFLDLQLFNQTHFGSSAYRTWAGMHNTALAIASQRCEDILEPEEAVMRRLSAGRAAFARTEWNRKRNKHYRRDACQLLSTVAYEHLQRWLISGDASLTAPAQSLVAAIDPGKQTTEGTVIAALLPSHVAALVFEAAGAHYLQDALSGGHIRTEHRSRELNTTRRYHDIDSKSGVVAVLGARAERHDFIAFGDTYLLGTSPMSLLDSGAGQCDVAHKSARGGRQQTTQCLLAFQRGIVAAANTASLLDWSLGGIMYADQNVMKHDARAPVCPNDGSPRALVCTFLPLQPITPAATAGRNNGYLAREGLPPTPPPVDFESLRIESALDGAGYGTQIGARLEFLTPVLKRGGDWMYSYDFGFLMTLGDPGRQQLIHEFAFTFHYRFATRLLMSAGPLTYAGFEGFSSQTNFFFGTGLGAAITILPEGWTKIPLELTLSYRAPWRLVDTNRGFDSQRVEAHWIALSIGLAFL